MVQIIGFYKLERNKNLDEFYEDICKTWEARKIMCNQIPTMQVTMDKKQQWSFKTVYISKIVQNSFKLDEEYTDKLPTGKLLKSITTMDGDHKFVTKSKGVEDPTFTIGKQYEFSEDGLVMTFQASNSLVVAKRYFIRILGP